MGKKLLLMGLITSSLLWAKDYALIVGIWDYDKVENFNKLNKSIVQDDIKIYQKILKDWEIEGNIMTLRNCKKEKIISTLNNIEKQINKGDRFYMFFTGHGLSATNKHYKNIKLKGTPNRLGKLMKNSGAIVTVDTDKSDTKKTLIIGCRDLRPILEEIDKKVSKGLIMFDACYSKNSSRDNETHKYINLSTKSLCTTEDNGYPYKKLVYIASSSIESIQGVISKGMKKCFKNNGKKLTSKTIQSCLINEPDIKIQRAKVFPLNSNLTIF